MQVYQQKKTLFAQKQNTKKRASKSIETLLTHLDMSARSPSHSRVSSFRGSAVLASSGRRVSSRCRRASLASPVASTSKTFVPAPRKKVRDVARTVRRVFEEHKGELKRVDTKKELTLDDVRSLFPNPEDGKTRRTVLACMTHLADFDSWEMARFLGDELIALQEVQKDANVVAVGIGSVASGELFCKLTGFPKENLLVTNTSTLYRKLGYSPGFGDALPVKLPGVVKVLLMCAGIGSPGTLRAVLSGYVGSKNKKPVLVEGSKADMPRMRKLYDATLGKEYLRPFEMATVRLANMTAILNNWEELACEDDQLLAQRGGAMVLDESGEVVFDHVDPGILGYCDPKRLMQFALLEGDPKAPYNAVSVMHEACETRNVDAEDVSDAILACEKSKCDVAGDTLNGAWELIYTTGTATGDGFYFPVKAVQSFDVQNERIRNGVYVGPVKLFFDGPFSWKQNMQMLEFTFTKCSVGVGSLVKGFDIDDSKWESAKPFFKFVYADDKCRAARGKDGGVALWKAVGPPETDANNSE